MRKSLCCLLASIVVLAALYGCREEDPVPVNNLDFTSDQIEWLKKDLKHVDKSTPLIISTHAPLFRPATATTFKRNSKDGRTSNFDLLTSAVEGYNVHLLTGHTHHTFNYKATDSFWEHNVGAVCAAWWWCGYYSPGVHLSRDGSPGGYGIFTIKGKEMTHAYKATGWDLDHQFNAYDMKSVKELVTMDYGAGKSGFQKYVTSIEEYSDDDILINVWDWDPDWTVTVTEDGKPLEVTPVLAMDPLHIAAYVGKRFRDADSFSFTTSVWNHFFKATASGEDGTKVEISVTDRNGNTFKESFTRPKDFKVEDYSSLSR